MKGPVFPVLAMAQYTSVKICYKPEEMSNIRLSDWIYQTQAQFAYDSAGTKWIFQYGECPVKQTVWNEFRNPEVKVPLSWRNERTYEVADLKLELYKLLEADDEALTEHVTADYLRGMIDRCVTFSELIVLLNKYVFAVNEEELWRELEENNLV